MTTIPQLGEAPSPPTKDAFDSATSLDLSASRNHDCASSSTVTHTFPHRAKPVHRLTWRRIDLRDGLAEPRDQKNRDGPFPQRVRGQPCKLP